MAAPTAGLGRLGCVSLCDPRSPCGFQVRSEAGGVGDLMFRREETLLGLREGLALQSLRGFPLQETCLALLCLSKLVSALRKGSSETGIAEAPDLRQ